MPQYAGGGPYVAKAEKPRIEKRARRRQVSDGGKATDGKARLCPDQVRRGLAQRFPRGFVGFTGKDPIAASGDEKHLATGNRALENDDFAI